ncbi:DnaJ-domain-containing protein [Fistulina hepatica ATCC 64428]|nr:DnaJ-domain-containing protein [Fistulina hepatica ATCC 64428]
MAILAYALSTASSYFHLPVDEQEDQDIQSFQRRYLTWGTSIPSNADAGPSSRHASYPHPNTPCTSDVSEGRDSVLQVVLSNDDLYTVLGVSRTEVLDKVALRRAYLARSRLCHPDKFPQNPEATRAFQKVSLAYDVLRDPNVRRMYDARSQSDAQYNVWTAHPPRAPDDTFRGAVLGVLNDFLDGDVELVRTLLKSLSDANPRLQMGDDGIDALLVSVRERALVCRACIYALHAELDRVLALQHAFRTLGYLDVLGRLRVTIQLTRVTLRIPLVIERAVVVEQNKLVATGAEQPFLPQSLTVLIQRVDHVLERMERII